MAIRSHKSRFMGPSYKIFFQIPFQFPCPLLVLVYILSLDYTFAFLPIQYWFFVSIPVFKAFIALFCLSLFHSASSLPTPSHLIFASLLIEIFTVWPEYKLSTSICKSATQIENWKQKRLTKFQNRKPECAECNRLTDVLKQHKSHSI